MRGPNRASIHAAHRAIIRPLTASSATAASTAISAAMVSMTSVPTLRLSGTRSSTCRR